MGLSIDDLLELQNELGELPERNPVIAGTGGLRKMRFAPAAWRRGKRGGVRVCYAYFPAFARVLFVMAYSKKTKDDISPNEKKGIRLLLRQEERVRAERTKDKP